MTISEDQLRSRHSEETEELRAVIKEKEKILANYRKEHGQLEIFFRNVTEALEPITPLKQVYEPIAKGRMVDSPVAVVG